MGFADFDNCSSGIDQFCYVSNLAIKEVQMSIKKFIFANRRNPLDSGSDKRPQLDMFDWIAMIFVIATPLFIAYKLFWN